MDQEADTQFLTSYSSFSDTPRLKLIYYSNIVSKNVQSQNSNKICIKKSQIKFSKQIPPVISKKNVPIKAFDINSIFNAFRFVFNPVPKYNNFINPNLRNNFYEKKNVAPVPQLFFQQTGVPVKAFYHPIVKENFDRQSGQEINHDYQSSTVISRSKIRIVKKVKNEKKVTVSQIIQEAISQQLKQSNAALDSRSKCLNQSNPPRPLTSSPKQSRAVSNSNLSTRPSSSKIDNTMILSNKQNASQLNLHKQGSSPNIKRRKIVVTSKGQ